MSYRVTVKGTRGAINRIRTIKRNTEDVSRAWPAVGAYMSRTSSRQFVTAGAHLGKPWKPLSPGYKLWKTRNGFSRKILVQGGQLRSEFTGRPMMVEEYHKNSATFGSNSDKAKWHHSGTFRNGKRHIPARPILYVTPTVSKDVKDIVAKRIIGRGYRG